MRNDNTKSKLYEGFHKHTKPQKFIINENNFTYRNSLQVLNTLLKKPQKILDIGCGAGTMALYLANKGHTVLGIDISAAAISAANKSKELLKLKNVSFKKMDFPEEIPHDTYDLIICSEVIEHLQDDRLALKKIYTLLRKGGVAFISTPSKNAPLHKLGLAKDFDKKVGHLRRYSLDELIEKNKRAGFSIINTKKTEGILRNFLFLNPVAGKSVRFIKFFLSDWVTVLDNISLKLFGESNIFVVVKK